MADGILNEQEAVALLAYLAAAAELTLVEPEPYGSFRLIDGASRLLSFLAQRVNSPRGDVYRQLKEQIDSEKLLMTVDPDEYIAFVRELAGKVARELVRINKLAGPNP